MGLFSTTHVHRHETVDSGPSKIEVTEKKAPTDESVRLLNEMQEKAVQNIIDTVHLTNNVVDGVAIAYSNSHRSGIDQTEYQIKFKLNGRDIFIKNTINRAELKLSEGLADQIAKHIASAVIGEIKPLIMSGELVR